MLYFTHNENTIIYIFNAFIASNPDLTIKKFKCITLIKIKYYLSFILYEYLNLIE